MGEQEHDIVENSEAEIRHGEDTFDYIYDKRNWGHAARTVVGTIKDAGMNSKQEQTPRTKPAFDEALDQNGQCKFNPLNLKRDFTERELKKSFRKFSLKFHPDTCDGTECEEAFKCGEHQQRFATFQKYEDDFHRTGSNTQSEYSYTGFSGFDHGYSGDYSE